MALPWGKNGKLLKNKAELIKYCKSNGIMLFTRDILAIVGNQVTGKVTYGPRPAIVDGGTLTDEESKKTYTQLHRAIADDKSPDGIKSEPTELYIERELFNAINADITDETDEIRRLSTLRLRRAFVCLDVSDFSTRPAGQQALIIQSLNQIIAESDWNLDLLTVPPQLEARLCIGDGYIYVFTKPRQAAYFGARLAHLIDKAVAMRRIPVEFHYRIGIHEGEVYTFWDPGRENWNYLGDGINGATRVLQAVGKELDDVVFVSGTIREHFLGDPSQDPMMESSFGVKLYEVIRDSLDNKGRHLDKHKNTWRVYQMNHTKIGSTPDSWGYGRAEPAG